MGHGGQRARGGAGVGDLLRVGVASEQLLRLEFSEQVVHRDGEFRIRLRQLRGHRPPRGRGRLFPRQRGVDAVAPCAEIQRVRRRRRGQHLVRFLRVLFPPDRSERAQALRFRKARRLHRGAHEVDIRRVGAEPEGLLVRVARLGPAADEIAAAPRLVVALPHVGAVARLPHGEGRRAVRVRDRRVHVRNHPAHAAVLHRRAEVAPLAVVVIRALHRQAAVVVQPVGHQRVAVAADAALRFLVLRRGVLRPLQLVVAASIGVDGQRQLKGERLFKIRHELPGRVAAVEKVEALPRRSRAPRLCESRRARRGHAPPEARLARLAACVPDLSPALQPVRALRLQLQDRGDAVVILQRLPVRQQPHEEFLPILARRHLCQRIRLARQRIAQQPPLRQRQRRAGRVRFRRAARSDLKAQRVCQPVAPSREVARFHRAPRGRCPLLGRGIGGRGDLHRGMERGDDGDGGGKNRKCAHGGGNLAKTQAKIDSRRTRASAVNATASARAHSHIVLTAPLIAAT